MTIVKARFESKIMRETPRKSRDFMISIGIKRIDTWYGARNLRYLHLSLGISAISLSLISEERIILAALDQWWGRDREPGQSSERDARRRAEARRFRAAGRRAFSERAWTSAETELSVLSYVSSGFLRACKFVPGIADAARFFAGQSPRARVVIGWFSPSISVPSSSSSPFFPPSEKRDGDIRSSARWSISLRRDSGEKKR